jgi:phasin family protein
MQENRKLAEEAKGMSQEAQEGVQRGLEAASRSFAEANKGFQALAAEMMNYSKATFDDAMRTWEQLIGVKSLDQAFDIQSQYAKRVYENHMAELSKLREMYTDMVRDASKPVEDATRRSG